MVKDLGNRWVHVEGKTWILQVTTTIPVYFKNDCEVILLDSGYAKDKDLITNELERNNLKVIAIIGSHTHVDHSGNHAYLKNKYGCEIVMPKIEGMMLYDYTMLNLAYPSATIKQLKDFAPEMNVKVDKTFNPNRKNIRVQGVKFDLIPLYGHTPEHTGIVTPDDVLYVGDVIVDETTLNNSKILSIMDWIKDSQSKDKLKKEIHEKYILAHSGQYDDISSLIKKNEIRKEEIASEIVDLLKERSTWTKNEIEKHVWTKFGMRSKKTNKHTVYLRNLNCLLLYLIDSNIISREFEGGTYIYRFVNN